MTDDAVVRMIVKAAKAAREQGIQINLWRVGVQAEPVNGHYEYGLDDSPGQVCMVGLVLLGRPAHQGELFKDFAARCGHREPWGKGFMEGSVGEGYGDEFLRQNFDSLWVRGYKLAQRARNRLIKLELCEPV